MKDMKRFFLTLAAMGLIVASASASKANSKPFTVMQADGTTLTISLQGDENFSWYTTTDGVIVTPSGGSFVLADIATDGTITPSKTIVHELAQRNASELLAVKAQASERLFGTQAVAKRTNALRAAQKASSTSAYFPHTGSPTALVILVNFSDTTFHAANPKASFEQLFNGDEQKEMGLGESRNYGSVKKYFSDMSRGAYTPKFKVVGPVTLDHSMAYYGADASSGHDAQYPNFIKDACTKASAITDFSDASLDSNNDGALDAVVLIYAGFGQNNGADANTIWAKCVNSDYGTYGGAKVKIAMMSHELNGNEKLLATVTPGASSSFKTPQITGVGVICHEFSHAMGLPDLYPTTTSAQKVNNQTMEYWSLMDGGEYLYNAYAPTAYTAWERLQMGWETPIDLSADGKYTLTSHDKATGKSYRLSNPDNSLDYLLVENIQNTSWNTHLYSHGLIAYRICLPTATVNHLSRPNNTAGSPGVTIVPADGLLLNSELRESVAQYRNEMKGDLFPGENNVKQLTSSQNLPNYIWRSGTDTEIKATFTDITENTTAGEVSFNYKGNTSSGIADVEADATETDSNIYSIDGRCMGRNAATLQRGIYIKNGKKIMK